MLRKGILLVSGLLLTVIAPHTALAQLPPTAEWAIRAQTQYAVVANITYLTATGYDSKLDLYRRRDVTTPQPTLIFFHDGGWVGGSKEGSLMSLVPWMEMGWNVVNVEYRLARVAPAPAAVEDAMCALRFVVDKAKDMGVDTNRIVVSGESAGGHLALAAGMIPESAGFTRLCAGGAFRSSDASVPKVAAIINWYGITDVGEMLSGPNARNYAVQWFGSMRNREEIARSVSPLTYVRAGLPPILSIQGDADPLVPFSQNVRLHDALGKAGVKNELVPIAGGGHGNFTAEERTKAYAKIRHFLTENGLSIPESR
jgi:acetyl esterase/lipase